MLARLLKHTGWKELSSLVSPAFFDVVPTRSMLSRARTLRGSKDDQDYRAAARALAERLAEFPLGASVAGVEQTDVAPEDGLPKDPSGDSERITTLYFAQLFAPGGHTLLDIRDAAFARDGGALCYRPAPWVVRWDGDFLKNLQQVYRGFYQDDGNAFRDGLSGLRLEVAEDLFRQHFGEDTTAQRFETKKFVGTFHEIFLRCRDHGVKLHPDFLPLGIYLAALYDALEARGEPVNVRRCFERAL